MKTIQKLTFLCAVVMLLFGCTTLRIASDFDSDANFTTYRTYNFYDKGLAKLKVNGLDRKRMLAAVDVEMQAKGFTKVENPDLLINLVVVKRERTDVFSNGFNGGWGWGGWGWGGWGPWGGMGMMNGVNRFVEGLFVIDFLDPKTKMHIWHGRGDGFNLDNFNKREERIREGVREILAQYPPSAE